MESKIQKDAVIYAYDFDGTLIKGDSFLLFSRFALSKKELVLGALKSIPIIVRWKFLRSINSSRAKELIFGKLFGGKSEQEMRERADKFAELLDQRINQEVLASFSRAAEKTEGVIVSASPSFWIEPWAHRHGFDRVIGTGAEVKNGVFTGRFSTPNCKGWEKVKRLLEVYPNMADYQLEAWGNSEDDRAMLNLADVAHWVKE